LHRREFIAAACCAVCAGAARASDLIEPHMHFIPPDGARQVAMTLDACMGETDMRILEPLIDNKIKVTIFATRRWLEGNAAAIKLLKANSDLFQVQNHGAQHLPAIIGPEKAYGLAPAGTANAVFAEVLGGEQAVTAAFGVAPTWYRDATALYTHDAMGVITAMNQKVAGFSLNGDIGASVSAETARARISAEKAGDVIISHINQPKRPAGAGVIEGILTLKAQGFDFVHLDDVQITAIA
jgi:peptidoglycan/xylan/chitin deacetylase (PgdA/CDA1 family)